MVHFRHKAYPVIYVLIIHYWIKYTIVMILKEGQMSIWLKADVMLFQNWTVLKLDGWSP